MKTLFDISFPWYKTEEEQKEENISQFIKDAIKDYNIVFLDDKAYVACCGIRVTLDEDSGNVVQKLFELRKNYVEDQYYKTYAEDIKIHDPQWSCKLSRGE